MMCGPDQNSLADAAQPVLRAPLNDSRHQLSIELHDPVSAAELHIPQVTVLPEEGAVQCGAGR